MDESFKAVISLWRQWAKAATLDPMSRYTWMETMKEYPEPHWSQLSLFKASKREHATWQNWPRSRVLASFQPKIGPAPRQNTSSRWLVFRLSLLNNPTDLSWANRNDRFWKWAQFGGKQHENSQFLSSSSGRPWQKSRGRLNGRFSRAWQNCGINGIKS